MTHRVALIALVLVACGRGKESPPRHVDGGPPLRRVIEPPPRDVRALPPHAITAAGVGPYKLRTPLAEIMKSLPSGPRMALLQIPGVVDYGAARDDGLLIGGERQGDASFIAVLREGIARTADGIGVGASGLSLVAALGPPADDPRIARDPALWVGKQLPGAQFVLDGPRVLGVVLSVRSVIEAGQGDAAVSNSPLSRRDGGPSGAAAERGACSRVPPDAGAYAGVFATEPVYIAGCFGTADAVAVSGDTVAIAARASAEVRARRVSSIDVRGAKWAAPVRVENERDEVIVVSEQRQENFLSYVVTALRVDGTRLTKVAEVEAYRLDEQSAAWMGAALDDLVLHLEVASVGDQLVISGLLVHAQHGQARTLAPLQTTMARRRRAAGEIEPERERGRGESVGADSGVSAASSDAAVDIR